MKGTLQKATVPTMSRVTAASSCHCKLETWWLMMVLVMMAVALGSGDNYAIMYQWYGDNYGDNGGDNEQNDGRHVLSPWKLKYLMLQMRLKNISKNHHWRLKIWAASWQCQNLWCLPEVGRVEESDGSTERLHELENGKGRRGLLLEHAPEYRCDLNDKSVISVMFGISNFLSRKIILHPPVC